ncbi:ABC transporter ATP-binding protein [uncultured Algimonas sp.]|uniref:ABC transporter ATP-binding protein n=1 Tax=uncultured Algimonas sp. TaxID=1547920 RepID=UPI00260D4B08|nr:ABC transporter ATP-binding protein [uncultured Algimonas sp.]
MTELRVRDLHVEADGVTLVDHVGFQVRSGEIAVLIGPNGAGKSMALRGALGLVPAMGSVEIDGDPVSKMSAAERARRIAYLPQSGPMAWPARVRDVVALGRFAYGASPSRISGEDWQAVETALGECQLTDLADRRVDTLSGGETARMHCARAFCARTPLLIADEPVAALDPAQAFRIMDLLKTKAEAGLGVLVVLHDITLAARYADRMILMSEGRILADGPTVGVLTPDALAELYGIAAEVKGREIRLTGVLTEPVA